MMINYHWYTTNYRQAAVYATLSSRHQFITNPSPSIGLKKSVDFIFSKFPGQFHIFLDAGTKYQNPGLSRTIRDVWHVWKRHLVMKEGLHSYIQLAGSQLARYLNLYSVNGLITVVIFSIIDEHTFIYGSCDMVYCMKNLNRN